MNYKKILGWIAFLCAVYYLGSGLTSAYIFQRRCVQILTLCITSYLVNLSTTLFQRLTHNRIVSPALLGFERMYLLIQIGCLMILNNPMLNPLIALFTMSIIGLIIYPKILKRCGNDIYLLLLIGTVFSTLMGALSTTLQMMMDPLEFSILQSQNFVSFNAIQPKFLGISVLLTVLILGIYNHKRHQFDVLVLGDDTAQSLGLDVPLVHKEVLFLVILASSLVTSLVGPLTFLGLLTSNLAQELCPSSKTKPIIITGTLLAFILLLGSQLIFERLFNFTGTITVFINLIGSFTLIIFMIKERKHD